MTEVYIPKVMYHYFWTPAESAWDGPGKASGGSPVVHPAIPHTPYFTWHPESL